jgi:hypothetical protein
MDSTDTRYKYNRFGSKGARVGQAVVDMMGLDQPDLTAGDIIEAQSEKFTADFNKYAEEAAEKYTSPFYMFILTGKEHWAVNVVRNWFIPRQTAPHASQMMEDYPNKTKSLYLLDFEKGICKLLWTLPSPQECAIVLRHRNDYDPGLVASILDFAHGRLDRDSYTAHMQ